VIVLDTNVISELMRPAPAAQVLAWANGLDRAAVAITAVNEAEILHGIARLPDGRRKLVIRQSWDALIRELFAGRVWPLSSEAAHWYAEVLCRREQLALINPWSQPRAQGFLLINCSILRMRTAVVVHTSSSKARP
jgi:predicted nucleic acid-binding protein